MGIDGETSSEVPGVAGFDAKTLIDAFAVFAATVLKLEPLLVCAVFQPAGRTGMLTLLKFSANKTADGARSSACARAAGGEPLKVLRNVAQIIKIARRVMLPAAVVGCLPFIYRPPGFVISPLCAFRRPGKKVWREIGRRKFMVSDVADATAS